MDIGYLLSFNEHPVDIRTDAAVLEDPRFVENNHQVMPLSLLSQLWAVEMDSCIARDWILFCVRTCTHAINKSLTCG